jgi:hypothetical protein
MVSSSYVKSAPDAGSEISSWFMKERGYRSSTRWGNGTRSGWQMAKVGWMEKQRFERI